MITIFLELTHTAARKLNKKYNFFEIIEVSDFYNCQITFVLPNPMNQNFDLFMNLSVCVVCVPN